MSLKQGKFITFEGVEGGGKSTQVKRLCKFLQANGTPVLLTKQPGGTDIGHRIRQILLHVDHAGMNPWCEALLYLADRAQHVSEVIRPALANGQWVICDRYQDSTAVYQGIARAVNADLLDQVFCQATDGLIPDLTFVLDVPTDIGLLRARTRNDAMEMAETEGRFEQEAVAFHEAVRRGFQERCLQEPERMKMIDARQNVDEVARHISQLCMAHFALHV